ncbi:aminotransferase family protein [Streptomyces flavofungini]|uniref:Aspartate aminotransferase family protein n=1 Tax=Streptomyces flavofungini TaxID=68200 RepID=A0ABS0X833_9ACTN|nr:aminotransferase class III-fold pyridoxal phosphate-dependent enzyme [Streptomyces flavofungini]MBJ3809360.1 aspartate aminotransferase family protein [Streptomyces flavofungini]GHC77809.1 aspartate aminotransferase family protein [Streptomyces flavofungini]
MIDPADYALWNSGVPRPYLKALSRDDLLAESDGVRVRDSGGRWYLDGRSGLWNVTLGYGNTRVKEAIKQQVDRLPFANSYGYGRPAQVTVDCAEALVGHMPEGINHVRFASNGAQAVEMALQLSRFLRLRAGQPERMAVFAMWDGFHGQGPGAGMVTGVPYLHHQTGPMLPEVHHAPGPFSVGATPGVSDMERLIKEFGPERVTAVIVEPVVGEGGHILSPEYLGSLGRFCREHDIHLIFDEVVTGMGRVGDFTRAGQLPDVTPDIITLGKGITSGYVPMSAVAIHDRLYDQLHERTTGDTALSVGSTNDGHAVAAAAALAVIGALTEDGVLENVRRRESDLLAALGKLQAQHPELTGFRCLGLFCGLELGEPGGPSWSPGKVNKLRMALESRGVLSSSLRVVPNLMLMPPLVITEDDVAEIAAALDGALTDVKSGRLPESGFAKAMG